MIGILLYDELQSTLCLGISFLMKIYHTDAELCFNQVRIKGKSLLTVFDSFPKPCGVAVIKCKHIDTCFRERRIGRGKIRIERERVFEHLDCSHSVFLSPLKQ